MNDRIEALVIVETTKPFRGMVKVNVIEECEGGGYTKKIIVWWDRARQVFGNGANIKRNFYYDPECERQRIENGWFIPPQFFSFIKLSNDIPPIDIFADEILQSVKMSLSPPLSANKITFRGTKIIRQEFYASTQEKIVPDLLSHLREIKPCPDNFLRVLRNIQSASLFINGTQRQSFFTARLSPHIRNPTENEITNFKVYKKNGKVPCVEYERPERCSFEEMAQHIANLSRNISYEELVYTLQENTLKVSLEDIGFASPTAENSQNTQDTPKRQSSTVTHTPKPRYHLTAGYSYNNMHIVDVPDNESSPISIEYRDPANPRRKQKYTVARGKAETIRMIITFAVVCLFPVFIGTD